MPLPASNPISLMGHSRPGEGITTKPKIAMMVRMTEDALDALQGLASEQRMEFEFGDRPGIHVLDQFFPMRFDREKDNHELFIRTTTTMRPNAPLRLSANILGKLFVEPKLSAKTSSHLRNVAAAEKKDKKKTILLETPPDLSPAPKGSRKPYTVVTKVVAKNYVNSPLSRSNVPSTSGVPSTAGIPAETVAEYRLRLVHYLALGPATLDEIVKNIGGLEVDPVTRQKILELLNETGEQQRTKEMIPAKDIKWQLRLQTWLEVRPYQFPDYTDNVRTTVARSARLRLSDMRIPETDPAWNEVRYRPGANAGTQEKPRNGILVMAKKKEPKGRGAKAKATPKVATPPNKSGKSPTGAASGSAEASIPKSSAKGKERDMGNDRDTEREEGEISEYNTPPRVTKAPGAAKIDRRLPGSRPPVASVPVAATPPKPSPSRPHAAPRTATVAPSPPEKNSAATKNAGVNKSSATKEPEKPVFVAGRAIKLQKPDVESKPAIKKESAATTSTTKSGMKRKKVEEEEEEEDSSDWGYEERRKARQAVSLNKAKRDREAADAVASKVASKKKSKADEPSPAKKAKRDQSPGPSKKEKEKDRSQASNVTSKKRRRSPVYSSSSSEEDDDDDDEPLEKKARTKASITSAQSSKTKSSKSSVSRKRKASLPSDPAELRALYSDTFVEYIAAYSVLCAQKNKLNAMLRRVESEGGVGSDSDGEILSPDELEELSSRHKRLHGELGEMRRAYDSMI